MKNIFKRLWFPTKLDNIGARYIYNFMLPILLLLSVFFKNMVLIVIIMMCTFVIRAIIIVRSSITLPLNGDFTEKYEAITLKKRKLKLN